MSRVRIRRSRRSPVEYRVETSTSRRPHRAHLNGDLDLVALGFEVDQPRPLRSAICCARTRPSRAPASAAASAAVRARARSTTVRPTRPITSSATTSTTTARATASTACPRTTHALSHRFSPHHQPAGAGPVLGGKQCDERVGSVVVHLDLDHRCDGCDRLAVLEVHDPDPGGVASL